jgi:hypothetical protein
MERYDDIVKRKNYCLFEEIGKKTRVELERCVSGRKCNYRIFLLSS